MPEEPDFFAVTDPLEAAGFVALAVGELAAAPLVATVGVLGDELLEQAANKHAASPAART